MATFNIAAKFNDWNEKEKLAFLRTSLSGIAVQLLWDADDLTFDQLVTKLKDRFGAVGIEERYQTELRCRRRREGESIRELAQDIRRLMSLAYPGDGDSRIGQHIARDAFLAALGDPDLQLRVRDKDPHTLEEAVKFALRREINKAEVESTAPSRHRAVRRVEEQSVEEHPTAVETSMMPRQTQTRSAQSADEPTGRNQGNVSRQGRDSSRKRERRNRATVQSDSSQVEEMMKKLLEVQEAMSVLDKKVEQYGQSVAAKTQGANTGPPRPPVPRPLSQQPPRVQQNPQPVSVEAVRPPFICWNCEQPGHLARQCPAPRRDQRRPPPHGPSVQSVQQQRQQPDQRQCEYRVAGVARSDVRTVNGTPGQPATYLRARVDGRECDCLLDTGSEVSILPSSLVPESQLKPIGYTLRAANGSEIAVLGQATVTIVTQWHSSTVTGLVTDHVAEVMLGIDWLTDNGAQWNFEDFSVTIGGHRHRLSSKAKGEKWCRRVIVQEDVTVQPKSQQNLKCKVVLRGALGNAEGVHWETEPAALQNGLLVARTLAPSDQYTDIPVRVMNLEEEPKLMKAGTVVSDLEPVEVLGPVVTELENTEQETHVKNPGYPPMPDYMRKLADEVDQSTPKETVRGFCELMMKYRRIFSESDEDLGLTDIMMHRIDTGNARPIRQPLRRFPPAHVEAISKEVDKLLAQRVIEPAASPWASNIVLVRKQDGSYRCCIDYRQLNSVTTKDAYPVPRMDACLDAMSGSGWYSALDMPSAYHQLYVAAEDSDKTAFICPRGMYKYRTMPFGLCNAGATFQRLMDIVMSGLHLDICLVYLDDIVVFSKTPEQHLERLEIVFDRLLRAGLKIKPVKCSFFRRSVAFLGHIVSDEGIETDPVKVQTVVDWPVPTSVSEVRSFLGLASYYRRFVKDFSKLAAPLNALTQKNRKFEWTEETQKSFEALKAALTSPPILAMPRDEGLFTLDTDASYGQIGAVLSQQQDGVERVIAFGSRSLDKREMNYCVSRKELLAIVHFLRYFKQYLLGRHFRIRTDHAALTWLRKTPDPIGQQARWLEQMEEYDFDIEHRPGTRHGNADALSRRPCPKKDCVCKGPTEPLFSRPADQPKDSLAEECDDETACNVHQLQCDRIDVEATPPPSGKAADCISPDAVSHPGRVTGPPLFSGLADPSRLRIRRHRQQLARKPDLERIVEEDLNVVDPAVTQLNPEAEPFVPFADATTAGVQMVPSAHEGPAVTNAEAPSPDVEDQAPLPWSMEGLKTAQKADSDVGFVYQLIESGVSKPNWNEIVSQSREVKTLWSFWPRLEIRGGVLYRRFESVDQKSEFWQVVLPRSHRKEFLGLIHSGPVGGHFGLKKTSAAVQSRAYWPSW